jgi:hypothetical protein
LYITGKGLSSFYCKEAFCWGYYYRISKECPIRNLWKILTRHPKMVPPQESFIHFSMSPTKSKPSTPEVDLAGGTNSCIPQSSLFLFLKNYIYSFQL